MLSHDVPAINTLHAWILLSPYALLVINFMIN